MNIEIKIPSPGESITEVELARWLVVDGDIVAKDQEVAEVESDKATLPVIASDSGRISILVQEGEMVKVGSVACTIDTSAKPERSKKIQSDEKQQEKKVAERKSEIKMHPEHEKKDEKIPEEKEVTQSTLTSNHAQADERDDTKHVKVTPLARKKLEENDLSIDDFLSGLKKITTHEVDWVIEKKNSIREEKTISREVKKVPLSQLRKKLSQRLVAVKNETAMLTTFNEVDMSEVMRLRAAYQKKFTEKHGVKLGFMSFFVKAASQALKSFPNVNAMLDGDEILYPQYVDISIAVQTEKGLMVPVLRNAEVMNFAEIERSIMLLAEKARKFRLSIDEMSGGTFTITNGGIFGSMLSTPLINPPQSAILGMHNIVERPVAVKGKVEIRPVMYVALSYDHRVIDGRDSVSFLYRIKEILESPQRILLDGMNADEMLLGI